MSEKVKWQFGTTPNTLAALVLAGQKTATCSAKLFYELDNTPLPKAEVTPQTILDGQGNPLVDISVQKVFLEQFGRVSEAFALAEGEGSLSDWREAHRRFFNAEMGKIASPFTPLQGVENGQITEEFELVCEQFNVIKYHPKSYQQWLDFAEQTLLENAQADPYLNPKADANLLLQAVTKRSKSAIFAFSETQLSDTELQQLAQLLVRRAKGEPMAYILGEKEFWSLPLKVSPATLIPRPDTERLVELALEWANKRLNNGVDPHKILHILDLGTGTGAIALALASELGERAQIVGVDRLVEAVALAEQNRQTLGFENVQFLHSDWFNALQGKQFDLIVSNPPYIDGEDENLQVGDVRFEPLSALVAENKGTADLAKIIENAPHYLRYNGALLLEHGWQQAAWVQQKFKQHQWNTIQTAQDYGGNDRVTWAQWTK